MNEDCAPVIVCLKKCTSPKLLICNDSKMIYSNISSFITGYLLLNYSYNLLIAMDESDFSEVCRLITIRNSYLALGGFCFD